MSRFTKQNEGFDCEACGRAVPPAQKTCRNHCPYCLCSKHVDINPGDRAHTCHGLMRARRYEINGAKGLVLIFKCEACGELKRNIALMDDGFESDNYDLILKLSLNKV